MLLAEQHKAVLCWIQKAQWGRREQQHICVCVCAPMDACFSATETAEILCWSFIRNAAKNQRQGER